MTQPSRIGAVAIGRNEGARLVRCLAALQDCVDTIVYVDSGSTDDSPEAARRAGATIVELDLDQPFTAARARNAGFAALTRILEAEFVQFIDGDCEIAPAWIAAAQAFLRAHPEVAVVCGRRRERHPEASVYNRLIDTEWDTPVGETRACGGDALMRRAAFEAVGGFNPQMIAGEEPELCVRLRQAGWRIHRIDAEMTLHDANLLRFGQWWTRARRAGHAYAEGAALHGRGPDRHNVAQRRRALIWGLGIPLAALLGTVLTPWALLLLLAWPAQVLRLGLRGTGWTQAAFLTLSKIPEALGVLDCLRHRLSGRRAGLIEYK